MSQASGTSSLNVIREKTMKTKSIPLIDAIRAFNHEAVATLLEAGADPNEELFARLLENSDRDDVYMVTNPMIEAVILDDSKSLSLLLAAGASVNQPMLFGDTADMNPKQETTCLRIAFAGQNKEMIMTLLNHGADPNDESFATPLFPYISNPDLFKGEIDGAAIWDAQVKNIEQDQLPPLALALKNNHSEVAQLLIEKGAERN